MAGETSNSGVFEATPINRSDAKRQKTVERLFDRISRAAERGDRQTTISGGLFGFLPTTHTADVYKQVGDRLRSHGIGVAVVRFESDEQPVIRDVSDGVAFGAGLKQVVDMAYFTRVNQQDIELPYFGEDATQIYPPVES